MKAFANMLSKYISSPVKLNKDSPQDNCCSRIVTEAVMSQISR